MRIFFVLVIISTILLSGCTAPEQKNCGNDKECLKNAFNNCENAYGIWKSGNGAIGVAFLGNESNKCKVLVNIQETNLSISKKNMTCYVPVNGSEVNFSISSDCLGELKSFFN